MVRWVGASFLAFALLGAWLSGAAERALARREATWGVTLRHGDLVFQDLDCGLRCALIRRVTRSRYSHVGVVVDAAGERVVWEALHDVAPVPLSEWVGRGRGRRVAAYRPDHVPPDLRARLAAMAGRPYDGDYQWDDARIYCSELVAKAWDVVLAEPHAVDLGSDAARIAAMTGGRLTSRTLLVSPADLVRSGRTTRLVDELSAP
ncbi:MAG: YiiX/YebB-like N1pC/P60 family cysteine hydrolase [Myxococcota bacterium]